MSYDKLVGALKHLPGQHNQADHAPKTSRPHSGLLEEKPGTTKGSYDKVLPAKGRVDEPGFKYSGTQALTMAQNALGVKGAKGVQVTENYWQDNTHRITMIVPHRVASPAKMGKNLKAAGYKLKKNAGEYKYYRNSEGHSVAVYQEGGGTGGGQEWGYEVNAYVWDSYKGEEKPGL